MDQAPVTCRPNAAQLVVPRGRRAHTRETASPSPKRGVADRAGNGASTPPRPPIYSLGGTNSAWGRSAHALRGPGDHGEETKRRAAAMMLSRTGRDKGLPLDHGQFGEGRWAPWGCVAGAPYRGTASPPPPPPACGCVWLCMAMCGCVWLCVDVYGCVWMCMAVCGCVWLCVDVCGCVWMCVAVCDCVWLCVAVCGCVWLCVPLCRSLWRCVAACGGLYAARLPGLCAMRHLIACFCPHVPPPHRR